MTPVAEMEGLELQDDAQVVEQVLGNVTFKDVRVRAADGRVGDTDQDVFRTGFRHVFIDQ